MTDQYCPICKGVVKYQPRYPNYVCEVCMSEGVEVNGKVIPKNEIDVYSNLTLACKVKGVICNAQEARFGGIVVQII